MTAHAPPPATAYAPPPKTAPEPTRTSYLQPVTFPTAAEPPAEPPRATVEAIAAALARRHPLAERSPEPQSFPEAPAEPALLKEEEERQPTATTEASAPATRVEEPPTEAPHPTTPPTPVQRPPRAIGDPLPIVHATTLAPFIMGWRIRPQKDAIVVAVKATAKIVAGAPAQIANAELPSGDVFSADGEASSLRTPSDFAIFKPRADVMLLADAYAPPGGSAVSRVQFRVGKHSWDLAVIGDRSWEGSTPTTPQPFKSMPLVWERALGGSLSPDNPVGRGFKTGTLLPNLERLGQLIAGKRDTPRPICFAPVSPKWRARTSKLGKYDRSWLDARWPYFPDDFDYAYFNAAPAEQQVPYPRGDETFDVTGVQPDGAVLDGKLPGVRPHVFAQKSAKAGGEFLALQMNLDTLLVDAKAGTLTLVWRGLLEVEDRDALDLDAIYVEEGPLGSSVELHAALARFVALSTRPSLDVASTIPENEEAPSPITDEIEIAKRARRPLPKSEGVPKPKTQAREPKAVALPRDTIAQWLKDGRSLQSIDLSGADLRELDLRGRDLRGAILVGAQLDGAQLDEANCAGMVASNLSAGGTTWTGADLTKADLTDAHVERADFSEANLTQLVADRLQAKGAKFDRARGQGASFVAATLDQASFEGGRLAKADFSSASLNDARFTKAKLPDAKWYEVTGDKIVLDDAELRDFRCEGAKITRLSAQRVAAPGSVWDKSDVSEGTFEGADLKDASFVAAVASRTIFNKVTAQQASFRGASLRKACFLKSDLTKATFEQADLTEADLRGATLDHAETWEAILTSADLRHASLVGTKLEGGAS